MLLLEFAFVIYVTVIEGKERNAGLLVLPPLVIGYDDLDTKESRENLRAVYHPGKETQEVPDINRRFKEIGTKNESRNEESITSTEEMSNRSN